MKLKMLRDKFTSARYQFSIATDMGSYLSMLNKDDLFFEWRIGWYLAWRDGRYNPQAKLRTYLLGSLKGDFISVYNQLNLDDALVKVAECSNFACHALAILLQDQKVTDEYNVCLASIGSSLNHTVVIMLPKKHFPLPLESDCITLNGRPKGMLIVDPWAMSMGYGADVSLVIKPTHYVYSELLEKIILPYQSINDPTVLQSVSSHQDSIGKISAKRKLKLEHRLFGNTDHVQSSSDAIPDKSTPSIKNK